MPDRLFSPLQHSGRDCRDRSRGVSMPDRLFSPLQQLAVEGTVAVVWFQCRIGFSPRCNDRTSAISFGDSRCFNAGSAFLPAATWPISRSHQLSTVFQCRIGFSPRCNSRENAAEKAIKFQCRIGFSPRCNSPALRAHERQRRVSMPDRLFSPLQQIGEIVLGGDVEVSMPDRLFSPLQRESGSYHPDTPRVSMPDRLFSPLQRCPCRTPMTGWISFNAGSAFLPAATLQRLLVLRGEKAFQCRIGFSPRCNTR
jgi:hypothetical protein